MNAGRGLLAITAIGAAGAVLAGCGGSSGTPAHRTHTAARAVPPYSQQSAFTCTITKGAIVVVHVPGEGHKARLADVNVRYAIGNGAYDQPIAVTGGVVPPAGMTLTWDDRPGRISRCKVTSYLP